MSCLGLTGCGGSGGDDDTTLARETRVFAGDDTTVNEGTTVALTGVGFGSDSFTFAWTFTITDPNVATDADGNVDAAAETLSITVTHPDTSLPDASFVAPTFTGSPVTIELTLTGTAADGTVVTDSVIYTIDPVNAAPTAAISVAQLSGFATNSFPAATTFTLDGSGSSDSDPIDSTAPIASFQWAQVAGPDVTTGVNLTTSSVSFTTPTLTTTDTLQFALTVTDSEGGTNTANVDIIALDVTHSPPTVNAGVDLEVFEGETILLSGSATSLSTEATPYSYFWSNTSSAVAALSNIGSAEASGIAPEVSSNETVVLNFRVTDQFNNVASDALNVTVKPTPLYRVNDTGVEFIAQAAANVTDPDSSFPGQDGDYGRDRMTNTVTFEKAGIGAAGFDYTKLDALGDEVSPNATEWSCVRDNVTGLIWEVKSNDNGLHDSSDTFTWFSEDTATNGGFEGDQAGTAAACSLTQCNTENFATTVNAAGLCGFFDWRLPSTNELLSLVHLGQTASATIDTDLFPNTASDTTQPTWYWTGVPNVDGNNGSAANSWAIDFSSGNDNFLNKSSAAFVRLVRGGR